MISVAGNRVSLLHDGEACFTAMLDAIHGARQEILLEMYWFGSDHTGQRFASSLAARAKEGLRVLITYDAIGSWDANRSMFQALRAAGCELYEFNPPRHLFRALQLNLMQRRNHRKMLIIDGTIGLTGGVNLGDPWAPKDQGGGGFRDDMVRLEGPVVAEMRHIFLQTFNQASQGPLTDLRDSLKQRRPLLQSTVRFRNARRKPRRTGRGRLLSLRARRRRNSPPFFLEGSIGVLTNQGIRKRRIIELAYLQAIRNAQHSILIANSYFIPRRAVRNALADAAKRGVRVTVLLPGVSDVPAAAFAARWLYNWHMRAGIELFEWQASILHSKVAVVDDRWCTIGTHNLDYRSFLYNLEVNVVAVAPDLATQLAARIRADMALATRVRWASWQRRPLTNRFLEYLCYRFRRLL